MTSRPATSGPAVPGRQSTGQPASGRAGSSQPATASPAGRPGTVELPWATDAAAVAAGLGSDAALGLTEAAAAVRLAESGRNELPSRSGEPLWRHVLGQLTDPMIVVLLVAAALTAIVGDLPDMVVILLVIAVNTTIGVAQEIRADHAIAALTTLTAPLARVVRDGVAHRRPAAEVVPGDLVRLAAGDVVPADARLLSAQALEANEAALTGESLPVTKLAAPVSPDAGLADRTSMVHAGTVVTRGRAEAVTTATGTATALGGVARLLSEQHAPLTPLQRRLARLGRRLSEIAVALCLLVAGLGVLRGLPLEQMTITAISLAVAAIPESLPAVVSLSLALGAQRMAARGALVRRLPAVETLGSVTMIASDKTGTLTEGTMAVARLWTPSHEAELTGVGYQPSGEVRVRRGAPGPAGAGGPVDAAGVRPPADLLELASAAALCSDARLLPPTQGGAGWRVDGDPTEGALLAATGRLGVPADPLHARYPRLAEVPFDAARARMTTVHRAPDGSVLVSCKGSPEVLLGGAELVRRDGPDEAARVRAGAQVAEQYAAAGYRVLAVATRRLDRLDRLDRLPAGQLAGALEHDLHLLGLVAIADPVRSEAAAAVRAAQTAGIIPVVITGDHPSTAATVASRLGILPADGRVVTGQELTRADGPPPQARVYARTAPEQKLDIVSSWRADGHIVAMTGDGVNDAPALRAADIGVAMGQRGTEVAKQAADVVLTDDNFATIVHAIEEGRRVYDNIRRFVRYGLSGGAAEILVMLVGPFLGLTVPLLPAQILWVNLLTHGLPGVALGVEPAEPDVLARPPRRPDEGLLDGGMAAPILWLAAVLAAASLGLGVWGRAHGMPWQSMVFAALALLQLGTVLGIRSETRHVWRLPLSSNRFLMLSVGLNVLLVLAALYWPPLQHLLGTVPLAGAELALTAVVSLAGLVAVEIGKVARLRRAPRPPELGPDSPGRLPG